MKRFATFLLFVSILTQGFSQLDERVFGQIGGTVGFDYTRSSGTILGAEFTNNQINYASIIFAGRMNFLELSNNSSLSLAVHPTLGIGRAYNEIGGGSSFSLRVPLFVELNLGAASTVSTRKNEGFAIGLGAQYVRYPMFGNGTVPVAKDKNNKVVAMSAIWTEPVLQMGYKFFGKNYYCREINLRASYAMPFGTVNNDTKLIKSNIDNFNSFGVMLSFLQYINY